MKARLSIGNAKVPRDRMLHAYTMHIKECQWSLEPHLFKGEVCLKPKLVEKSPVTSIGWKTI